MTRDEAFEKIRMVLTEGHVETRKDLSEEFNPEALQEYKDEDKERFEEDFQKLRDAQTIGDLFLWMSEQAFDVSGAVATAMEAIIDGPVKEEEFYNVPLRNWDT